MAVLEVAHAPRSSPDGPDGAEAGRAPRPSRRCRAVGGTRCRAPQRGARWCAAPGVSAHADTRPCHPEVGARRARPAPAVTARCSRWPRPTAWSSAANRGSEAAGRPEAAPHARRRRRPGASRRPHWRERRRASNSRAAALRDWKSPLAVRRTWRAGRTDLRRVVRLPSVCLKASRRYQHERSVTTVPAGRPASQRSCGFAGTAGEPEASGRSRIRTWDLFLIREAL